LVRTGARIMTTRTRTIAGRIQNDPAHHSPHVDPAHPGDDRHQSPYEQDQYLKAHAREKNQLMKQFCKLEGPSGNSAAYQRGWDLAFGTPEAKARAAAEIEAEKTCGDPLVFFPGGITPEYVSPPIPAGPDSGGPPTWNVTITGIDP
jgi:hypothetical protein